MVVELGGGLAGEAELLCAGSEEAVEGLLDGTLDEEDVELVLELPVMELVNVEQPASTSVPLKLWARMAVEPLVLEVVDVLSCLSCLPWVLASADGAAVLLAS